MCVCVCVPCIFLLSWARSWKKSNFNLAWHTSTQHTSSHVRVYYACALFSHTTSWTFKCSHMRVLHYYWYSRFPTQCTISELQDISSMYYIDMAQCHATCQDQWLPATHPRVIAEGGYEDRPLQTYKTLLSPARVTNSKIPSWNIWYGDCSTHRMSSLSIWALWLHYFHSPYSPGQHPRFRARSAQIITCSSDVVFTSHKLNNT